MMQIAQEHVEAIEDIIGWARCPKDFDCYRTGFEHSCKAAPVVDKDLVACREPHACSFQIPIGDATCCSCPVRQYIAKHFGR